MDKPVSHRMRCCAVIMGASVLTSLFLRFFEACFIANDLSSLAKGFPGFVATTLILPFFACGLVLVRLDPLEKMLQRIRAGEKVREDERRAARAATSNLPWIIIPMTAIGCILCPLIFSGLETSPIRIMEIICLGVAMTLMASIQQIAMTETLLGTAKSELDIRSIRIDERDMSLSGRVILIAICSMIFGSVFSGVTAFSFYQLAVTSPGQIAGKDATLMLVLAGVWIFCTLWGFFLIRMVLSSITNRIERVTSRVQELTDGGTLEHRVDLIQMDEIGVLGFKINRFVDSLSFLLTSVKEAARSVTASAGSLGEGAESAEQALGMLKDSDSRVRSASKEQSDATEKARIEIESVAESARVVADQVSTQAGFVEQSSASIAEMAANIASVTRLTEKADELSSQLKATSDSGEAAIRDTVSAIRSIEEASHSVSAIVKVIQKISAQTNLLSMNAAIEAAHAGASGAGFAVVADEVRTLAEESAKSAKEIESLVHDMVSKIGGGVRLSDTAAESFKRIAQGVVDNEELIRTIAASMDEQKIGADEILSSINALVEATIRIKDLSLDQKDRSERMKEAVSGINAASERIEDAAQDEASSTGDLDKVVALIRRETEKNRISVGALQTTVERFK